MPPSQRIGVLAYSPMLHARLFADSEKYRLSHFQPTTKKPFSAANPTTSPELDASPENPRPYLDGNPAIDRPLIVQFCANDPTALLAAAKLVAPHCDAVDLNLGCPQGIARKGHYGAFLQEDQQLIYDLIRTLHEQLPVPVTAKIRVLETREATLAYARNVLAAGASFLTVHGRLREQKGHLTGLADWEMIRFLRDSLPPDTVLFANGNILQHGDVQRCLAATGADAVMSAEGNLSDPAIFAPEPAVGKEGREYWRGRDGRGGWRVDAVMRRYLDILHRYVDGREPPQRRPLFLPDDDAEWLKPEEDDADVEAEGPPRKKQRRGGEADESGGRSGAKDTASRSSKADKGGEGGSYASPNWVGVQAHLFHMLRHFVSRHTDVRDALARSRLGIGAEGYERILAMVERRVAEGLLEYERTDGKSFEEELALDRRVKTQDGVTPGAEVDIDEEDETESSVRTARRCKRPWWVAQPIVRPLPKEAMAKGAVQLSKKEKKQMEKEAQTQTQTPVARKHDAEQSGGDSTPRPSGDGSVPALEKNTDFQSSELVSG